MTSTLQDAIGTVRRGDRAEAQRQLAEVIQSDPDNVQAWYLLSQIVDSDARRAAYLSKTLALDPFHERAWAEFFSLPVDVVNRLEPGQEPAASVAMAATTGPIAPLAAVPSPVAPTADIDTALPDWLRPVAKDQPVVVRRREAPVPAVAATVPQSTGVAKQSQPAAESSEKNRTLSVLLAVLVIATILVLAFLVYLLLQS